MDRLIEKKNGELYYYGFNLKDLAVKYGTPLKITFLDVIKERVLVLKKSFDEAIKQNNYSGKFIYLNANKANYGMKEIEESFIHGDGLETSSYYDALLTHELFKKHPEFSHKYIVSNGYKEKNYIDEIVAMNEEGYQAIDIIDSLDEYNYLKQLGLKLEVGLRIHLSAKYAGEEEIIKNDRFGLNADEFEYIINDIKNTDLNLTTIHFHQRGFDYEDDKFLLNFDEAFINYYVKAKKHYQSIKNFDMGGGTPLPITNDFDYTKWANELISHIKSLSKENGVNEPNLISENGKYSQKDSTVNIYKIVGRKNTDKFEWNIIDGSLLIAMPEMYALGEPILVRAINHLDLPTKKTFLGGITCDCDDVYFEKDKGYFPLPDTNEDTYIALLGTGSYQNSMNGKGGVHHCLLPEEKDVIIYTKDGKLIYEVRNELQTFDKIINKI